MEKLHKTSAFFARNWAYFFAPVFALCAYFITLWLYGVYPFGGYTVASYDLSAQICPFIEHFFDVLDGKSTWTYSYAIAGGADVTGTFLYFFISPFSFLFLILGDGMVLQAASFVLPLKLAAVAFAGTWFSKRLFENIPDYLCAAVGIVYAYCGYTFVSNTYINWTDFLIYLPFCAGAFRRFVRTGNFLPFSLLLACCVYTCFSIACFSMFTVFPALVFYGILCIEKDKCNRFLTRLCVAFFVAILLALPVLLPALAAYVRSGRGGGLFDNFWVGFTRLPSGKLGEFSQKAFLESWGDSLFRKWSYILSDSVFFTLTLVWFLRGGAKTPFKKFMLVAGALVFLPTIVDEAMLLLNMGSYMSYALRFGFLSALYLLGGACLALDGICYDRNRAYDAAPLCLLVRRTFSDATTEKDGSRYALKRKKGEKSGAKACGKASRKYAVILLIIGAFAVAFFIYLSVNGNYKKIWTSFVKDTKLRDSLQTFSGRFAHSLGGLEVIAVLFGVVLLVTGVGCAFVSRKKIGARLLSFVLLAVVGVQVLFYNNQLVVGNISTVHEKVASYQTLTTALTEREKGEYFRIKDYNDSLTSNVPFAGGGNAFSVFSSVIDKDNFTVYNLFGYNGNGINNLKSAHDERQASLNAELGDSFLGYKYFFVTQEEKNAFDKDWELRQYMKPVLTEAENGETVPLCDGEYYVYENTLVFPTAYRVQGGAFRFECPNELDYNYRRANQRALYAYLRGKTLSQAQKEFGFSSSSETTVESVRELSAYLWSRAATKVEVGANTICATVSGAEQGENLFLNFVAAKGYRVFVNGQERPLVENDLHFLCVALDEGENAVEFAYTSPYPAYALYGVVGGLLGLVATWFVLKKTRLAERCAPVLAWAGIALATALIAFFFLYPTAAWVVKLIKLLV